MTLPLGPMTSPILSIGISKVTIFGAVAATSARGSAIAAFMTSRICRRASLACCSAAASTSAGMPSILVSSCRAVTNVGRAGDLEVHVAEGVLGTEDVGEGRVLALGEDEAHGDAGDRRLDRHAGVHQRQADEAQTDAIDVEPLEDSTSETRRSV